MTDKLPLDIDGLLPDSDDRCVDRLVRDLTADSRIEHAHLLADAGTSRLCVHYDSAMTAADVEQHTRRIASNIDAQYGHLRWAAADLAARPGDIQSLVGRLDALPGVVETSTETDGLRIEFERDRITADELVAVITGGHTPSPVAAPVEEDHGDHEHGWGMIFGERSELIFAGLSGASLLTGFLLASFADTPRSVEMVFYGLAFVLGAFFTAQEAWQSVRAKRFEIDFLMLVAAAARPRWARSPKGRCCCSCSASAMPWRDTRWGARGAPSRLWPILLPRRPRAPRPDRRNRRSSRRAAAGR